MNLTDYFDTAMTYDTYLTKLGGHLALHQLHYKKFIISTKQINALSQLPPFNILVITESWCGDSLALLPIVYKMSEYNSLWELKIVLRNENPELMDRFVTNGTRSIPIFLFLDAAGDLLFRWGPRPEVAKRIFRDHKQQIASGEMEKSDVLKKIRTYYAKDRGRDASKELLKHLKKKCEIVMAKK
jgi:hypothetical protein